MTLWAGLDRHDPDPNVIGLVVLVEGLRRRVVWEDDCSEWYTEDDAKNLRRYEVNPR